jgi:hypothetical protein
MWKEVVVVYLKVLSHHLYGRTEKTTKNLSTALPNETTCSVWPMYFKMKLLEPIFLVTILCLKNELYTQPLITDVLSMELKLFSQDGHIIRKHSMVTTTKEHLILPAMHHNFSILTPLPPS